MGPVVVGASRSGLLVPVLLMGRSRPPHWVDHVLVGPDRSTRSTAPAEVTVNLKKVLTWLFVAFIVFYVVQAPESSAQFVRNAGEVLADAASSLADFVSSLA